MAAANWATPVAWRGARRVAALAFLACFAATNVSARIKHPLPPRRPDLPTAAPAKIKPTPPEQPDAADLGDACYAKLRAAGVIFEQAPAPTGMIDGCGVEAPVRLSSVALRDGRVELKAKPLLGCPFALLLSDYIRNLAAPLGAATMDAPLVAIDSGPGYQCRGRNGDAGAKISAHGKGVAIDLSGFVFANGRRIAIEDQSDAHSTAYLKSLRTAACGWFTTVLGPGSDPYHASHLHLDAERHGSSDAYRICQ